MFQTMPRGISVSGGVCGPVEADGLGTAARERPGRVAPHGGEREVVANHRDARLADVADELLQAGELLLLAGPVEQDVVPVADLEVLERGQLEPLGLDGPTQVDELVDRPDAAARGDAPATRHRLRIRDARPAGHVVDEVRDDRLRPRLPREPEVLGRQHLLVQAESRLHLDVLPSLASSAPGGADTCAAREVAATSCTSGTGCCA